MDYVGIDVSKDQLQVCLLTQGRVQRQFANRETGWRELTAWLSEQGEVWVALEATGRYSDGVSQALVEAGIRLSVVNPARIAAYRQSQLKRHKTDAVDAQLIADFCRTQQPPLWAPPTPAERELRALVRHRDDLKDLRQAERNRLESQPPSATVVRQLRALLVLLDGQIAEVEQQIRDHVDRHPDLKAQHNLLTSIPGIGDQTSVQLLAELGDLRRFTNVRQVVALVGLNPQQRHSGSSIHYTAGIARMGRSSLRAALYLPAVVAKRHNPLLKAFAERLAARGLSPQAVVVAVMRKLLHLAYGVIRSNRPFDPHFGQPSPAVPVTT